MKPRTLLIAAPAAVALTTSALVSLPAASATGATTTPSSVYTLVRASNPTADQADAYKRITAAMDKAVARWERRSSIGMHLTVHYIPGVPTAEGGYGSINFGTNRSYMVEGTALHEIAHNVGIGTASTWSKFCVGGKWTGAQGNATLAHFDGAGSQLSCGGGHAWPYGLNYSTEWQKDPATIYNRNIDVVTAMRADMNYAPATPKMRTDSLMSGTLGNPYAYTLAATGAPYPTYSITAGRLPAGLTLNVTTGTIWGTPTEKGTFTLTATASAAGVQNSKEFVLSIYR